ncbi:MAG: alcohol dehydrogenase catalytic domain-containing protein [Planctomycetes bacterium]|nr:alcohol dehydrogenase catalytic domain-containing protein [Planctomycetota bacterium]
METAPLPDALADGSVLVRVDLATICGSDLHTWLGRRPTPIPGVLGHEGVGRVVAVGHGVGHWLGRRITWSLAASCGRCAACTRHGLPQKCRELKKVGHDALESGDGWHGTYASHLVLPAGTHLVEVPASIPDRVAAPANCAWATVAAMLETLPQPCELAVVQGAGMLGLGACAMLRARGVERVVVVDVAEPRLAHAAAFGAEPALATARAHCAPRSADLVVELSGDPRVVAEGLDLLRPGGAYHFAGFVHPDSRFELAGERLVRGCLVLRGFHNYAPRHLDQALAYLADPPQVPWPELIPAPLPLERLDEAFALAAQRTRLRIAVRADLGPPP